jgi:thioredoxin-related protein
MKNLQEKIQTAANIAVILVAILLGASLVKPYIFPSAVSKSAPVGEPIKVGTKLPLTDVDWNKSEKNLVLVLSSTCRFCNESAPFYQKLVEQKAGNNNIKFIAVMPQKTEEAKQYLDNHKIAVDEIKQMNLETLNIKGTPTLILVDNTGAVAQSWAGKLPPEKEREVLQQLFGGEHASHKH